MRQPHLNPLLAIEYAQQQHHPLISVHGQKYRFHVGEVTNLNLHSIARVQGAVHLGCSAAVLEMFDYGILHLTRLATECDNAGNPPRGA